MPIPLGILAVAGAGAAGGGAFDLLETITTSGTATASVTFSSLGSYSDYKHLQIRATVRNTNTGTSNYNLRYRLNSDSGSNYSRHTLSGNGSSVSSGGFANLDYSDANSCVPANGTTANIFGAVIIDILDFNSTSKNTTVRSLGGVPATENHIVLTSGAWYNTNAVTSIELYPSINNFAANCRLSLYGVK